jgi:hypothetical protein
MLCPKRGKTASIPALKIPSGESGRRAVWTNSAIRTIQNRVKAYRMVV